jgi:Zn-dependent protease
MRDPLTWSLSLGRIFGVSVRVHVFFWVFALGCLLRVLFGPPIDPSTKEPYPFPYWQDGLALVCILFVSVLLHELGHCFGAYLVQGDVNEVMLWPLGGLAPVEVPHTWRAQFVAAAAGPTVNLLICVTAAVALAVQSFWPPLPWSDQLAFQVYHSGNDVLYGHNQNPGTAVLSDGQRKAPSQLDFDRAGNRFVVKDTKEPLPEGQPLMLAPWPLMVVRIFWVNSLLLLLNLLPAFPLDGGRILQALFWSRVDYRTATQWAISAGYVVMVLVGLVSIAQNSVVILFLAGLIYAFCRHQSYVLETGGDEPLFGYDFSQGYTSLERDQPTVTRRRQPNFIQRWIQRRKAKQIQRDQEQREAEERRMDELLEKVQRDGLQSLTDEERRFMTRVSARYRRN